MQVRTTVENYIYQLGLMQLHENIDMHIVQLGTLLLGKSEAPATSNVVSSKVVSVPEKEL